MRWIEQAGKSNCGQIAVAVITGAPLDVVTKMIGHSHGTTTRSLVRVLRQLGFRCQDNCRSRTRPDLGLAQLHDTIGPLCLGPDGFYRRKPRAGWHWVVVDGERVWDGVWGGPTGEALWPEGYKLTSFLAVER